MKPLYFKENEQIFSKFLDKIIYIECSLEHFPIYQNDSFNQKMMDKESEEYKTVWKREKASKDCAKRIIQIKRKRHKLFVIIRCG